MMGWGSFCSRVGGYGAGHMWGLGSGGGLLGVLGSLLGTLLLLGLLALFAAAAIWLISRSRITTAVTGSGPSLSISPLDLAQRRLAAGEITLDEYHRIRDELRG